MIVDSSEITSNLTMDKIPLAYLCFKAISYSSANALATTSLEIYSLERWKSTHAILQTHFLLNQYCKVLASRLVRCFAWKIIIVIDNVIDNVIQRTVMAVYFDEQIETSK